MYVDFARWLLVGGKFPSGVAGHPCKDARFRTVSPIKIAPAGCTGAIDIVDPQGWITSA
jgi:hypothetical protein